MDQRIDDGIRHGSTDGTEAGGEKDAELIRAETVLENRGEQCWNRSRNM